MLNAKAIIVSSATFGLMLLAALAYVGFHDSRPGPPDMPEGIEFTFQAEEFGGGKCQPKRVARIDWKGLDGLGMIVGTIKFTDIKTGTSSTERLDVDFNRIDRNGISTKTSAWSIASKTPCANLRIEQTIEYCLYRTTRRTSSRDPLLYPPDTTKYACPSVTILGEGFASILLNEDKSLEFEVR